jgi:hypothetical protein
VVDDGTGAAIESSAGESPLCLATARVSFCNLWNERYSERVNSTNGARLARCLPPVRLSFSCLDPAAKMKYHEKNEADVLAH